MKNRYPVKLPAVAAIAFVVAIFSSTPLPAMAVLAYAVLAEQDSWLIHQTLVAFWMSVLFSLLHRIASALAGWGASSVVFLAVGDFFAAIVSLLLILLTAVAVFAITRVARGKDAQLLFFSSLCDWCMGKVRSIPVPPPPQQNPQVQNPERRASPPPSTDRSDPR